MASTYEYGMKTSCPISWLAEQLLALQNTFSVDSITDICFVPYLRHDVKIYYDVLYEICNKRQSLCYI